MEFDTPILFLIFNRPEETKTTFQSIRNIRPYKLYVAADGPRLSKKGEDELCRKTREILVQIDWECEIKTLFRSENLGCRNAVSSAITWFFENEPEGIIIEDDCVADTTFYTYCKVMLEKYRDNEQVMHISGTNYQNGILRGDGSYYFSRIPHIWGWATWRRAWAKYDINMTKLPEFIYKNEIVKIFDNKRAQREYVRILKKVYYGGNTWDFQWAFSCFIRDAYCVTPNVNLIQNIGFGESSTHIAMKNDPLSKKISFSLTNIIDPTSFDIDFEADNFEGKSIFQPKSIIYKIAKLLLMVKRFFLVSIKNDINT